MNSTIIRELCKQLKDEAEAISSYTESLAWNEIDDVTKTILTEIRNDELGHAQKIIVALTAVMMGEAPEVAERMDAANLDKTDKDGDSAWKVQ